MLVLIWLALLAAAAVVVFFIVRPPQMTEAAPDPISPAVEVLPLDSHLMSDPDALTVAFDARLIEWANAGATRGTARSATQASDTDTFVAELASQSDQIYADSIAGTGWEKDAELSVWVESMAKLHAETVAGHFDDYAAAATRASWVPTTADAPAGPIHSFLRNPDQTITIVSAGISNQTVSRTFAAVDGQLQLRRVIVGL